MLCGHGAWVLAHRETSTGTIPQHPKHSKNNKHLGETTKSLAKWKMFVLWVDFVFMISKSEWGGLPLAVYDMMTVLDIDICIDLSKVVIISGKKGHEPPIWSKHHILGYLRVMNQWHHVFVHFMLKNACPDTCILCPESIITYLLRLTLTGCYTTIAIIETKQLRKKSWAIIKMDQTKLITYCIVYSY